jgi:hypothetical protein
MTIAPLNAFEELPLLLVGNRALRAGGTHEGSRWEASARERTHRLATEKPIAPRRGA